MRETERRETGAGREGGREGGKGEEGRGGKGGERRETVEMRRESKRATERDRLGRILFNFFLRFLRLPWSPEGTRGCYGSETQGSGSPWCLGPDAPGSLIAESLISVQHVRVLLMSSGALNTAAWGR